MSHCIVKFRGAHIQHDCLKAGIAVFPADSDRAYALHYVPRPIIPKGGYPGALDGKGIPIDEDDFRTWLESLPTRMELNPVFTHFIRISPTTTLPQLETELQRILNPDVLTSADAFLSDQGRTGPINFSRFRKLMQTRERLGSGLVLPKGYDAANLIAKADKRFKNIGGELDGKGKILDIEPGTIDIGAAAIDREYGYASGYTRIGKENPANANGSITSVQIYAGSDLSGCEVATFIDEGSNNFSTRDSETIGSVTSGSTQTFSGLDMAVQTGDYLGIYYSTGTLDFDATGAGAWMASGDLIPCSSQTFSLYTRTLSLYGEGEGEGATEKESSDTGSGADAKESYPAAAMDGEETGSGTDSLPAREIALPDSGAGVDALVSLQTPQAKTSNDTASGVDAVESLQTLEAKTASDSGSGAEVALSSATLEANESGAAIEALIVRLLAGEESGSALESSQVEGNGEPAELFADETGEGADRLAARIEMPVKGGGMRLWT
jgi:hypothetical protein